MSLAALFNVPSTQPELDAWAFAHMAHHRDLNSAIQKVLGVQLPEYILEPIDPADPEVFLAQHQDLHIRMDFYLGIAGYDLSQVDWKNKGQFAAWIDLNGSEHVQAAQITGVG